MHVLSWHQEVFTHLAASAKQLPHALLLRGPRGIGKLVFARALAQALLCETQRSDNSACGTCSACVWFEGGGHPDFRQIEPVSESAEGEEGEKKSTVISVDQIRVLPEFVNISSHRGGPKVLVIHPAEMLNINASNALLKTLEEPPPRTYFVLVTHRAHQLLATVKSRCRQITLRGPDTAAAAAWLSSKGVHRPELALAQTGNAPLLALQLNESEYWGKRAAFLSQLGGRALDVSSAAEALGDSVIPHVVSWLQKWSYDLVSYRMLGTLRYNPDQAEAIARIASQIDPVGAVRFHREMVKLQLIAHHPLNPRLFIENVLLAYADLVNPHTSAVP